MLSKNILITLESWCIMLKPVEFPLYNRPFPEIMVENGIEILYFCDKKPGYFLLHSHDFIEVILVLDGDVAILAEGTKYEVNKGNIAIMPNGTLHRTVAENADRYERYVLHIELDYIKRLTEIFNIDIDRFGFLYEPNILECNQESVWRLISILGKIVNTEERNGNIGSALLQCYTFELLITLLDIMNKGMKIKSKSKNVIVDKIVHYINDNFSNPALDMDTITSEAFFSPGYLSRLFKSYTGTSIYNFLIQKRLEHSRELIKEGKLITEAYLEAGFSDYTSYLKSFKKTYNETPKEFQDNLK